MKFNSIKEMTLFEHQFWLQILGDHSRFILNALSPLETDFIYQADSFSTLFDNLLKTSRLPLSKEDLNTLTHQAYAAAVKFREFKLNILSRQITIIINISLPPTFINHMINELDEYLFILTSLMNENRPPVTLPIHLHLLWLLDGSGHASTISSSLDMTQKELIEKSKKYSKEFNNLYLRTMEYSGYMRTGMYDFPSLDQLNSDADEIMISFRKFLQELETGIIQKKVLSNLSPLTPDHMLREECYYLTKLSMVSKIKEPECDPTRPRIEI